MPMLRGAYARKGVRRLSSLKGASTLTKHDISLGLGLFTADGMILYHPEVTTRYLCGTSHATSCSYRAETRSRTSQIPGHLPPAHCTNDSPSLNPLMSLVLPGRKIDVRVSPDAV